MMRILVAIVHHWNPEGSGRHQSLRPDPQPRIQALREQILAFSRLGRHQLHLDLADQAAYAANLDHRHQIDLHLVTDGRHHVFDQLDAPYRERLTHVPMATIDPLRLGFEAQRHLAAQLDAGYDLLAYFEDDLIIHDPMFFHKIHRFVDVAGLDCLALPQRFELLPIPSRIDKLYIDGVMPGEQLKLHLPDPVPPLHLQDSLWGDVTFESPRNPHAGCFVLRPDQLRHWSKQSWWLDGDCSFISPLESAATLGLLKTFRLYKPSFASAMFLEAQHWGTNFLTLMAQATPHQPAAHG